MCFSDGQMCLTVLQLSVDRLGMSIYFFTLQIKSFSQHNSGCFMSLMDNDGLKSFFDQPIVFWTPDMAGVHIWKEVLNCFYILPDIDIVMIIK